MPKESGQPQKRIETQPEGTAIPLLRDNFGNVIDVMAMRQAGSGGAGERTPAVPRLSEREDVPKSEKTGERPAGVAGEAKPESGKSAADAETHNLPAERVTEPPVPAVFENAPVPVPVAEAPASPAPIETAPSVPSAEETPPAPPAAPERLRVVMVEAKGAVEEAARDIAERKLEVSAADMRGVKGVVSRIWKQNLFREYYRQKEIASAKEEILRSGSLFGGEAGVIAHKAAMDAVVKRFASEYDESIHAEAGERRERLSGERSAGAQAEIRSLITRFARGEIDQSVFAEEKNRVFAGIKGLDQASQSANVEYADNLLDIARQARMAVSHGRGLENLDLDFDVVIGEAKSGVRTEAQFNAVDRLVSKIQASKVGRFVNETTVASAVSIAYSLGGVGLQKTLSGRLAAWGSFGATAVLSSALAGLRENVRLKEERRAHAREIAQGRSFDTSVDKRRAEMERSRYETKSAGDLLSALRAAYDAAPDGKRTLKGLSGEEFAAAVSALTEIKARISLSDRKGIDLISFSDVTTVEKERLDLDVLRAECRLDLERFAAANPGVVAGESFADYLRRIERAQEDTLLGGIESSNRIFNRMKEKRVAGAVARGLVTGLTIGMAAQELGAFFREGQEGFIEGLVKGRAGKAAHTTTALEGLRRYLEREFPDSLKGESKEVMIGRTHFRLPFGAAIETNPDGTFNLIDSGRKLGENLSLDQDGTLSDKAESALKSAGVIARTDIGEIAKEVPGRVEMSSADFVEKYKGLFTEVHRTLWYDNDTPGVFDKNELRLWWGGQSGSGLDEHGNYVMSVRGMTPEGSVHGEFSVDAVKAVAEGKVKMAFSISADTQKMVIDVPIDSSGNAVIDPKSELGHILFRSVDGHAEFIGKYAEVVEVVGVENGVEEVRTLATAVGSGLDGLIATGPKTIIEQIPSVIIETPGGLFVDPPPFIPVIGRYPLELTKREAPPTEASYYFGTLSPERRAEMAAVFSETIVGNPDADLSHYAEIESYFGRQDREYLRQIESLAGQIASPMPEKTRLSVCIPVAGHQEDKNIRRTLENYLNQTAPKDAYEINIFVNHPDKDKDGNPTSAAATLAEIEKFRAEHPEVNVNVMYQVLPLEKAKIGYIRKLLNDAVLMRHHQRGQGTEDLIIVSNDADNKGLSPQYIDNYLRKLGEGTKFDAMLGMIDWDPETYARKPLIHVGTRLFQYMDAYLRHQPERQIGSSGANFAFKSGIYAAVGGYDPASSVAEDVHLGQKIKAARWDAKKREAIGFAGSTVSRIYTSARRAESAFEEGRSPAKQWEKFGANDELRRIEWEKISSEPVNFDDPGYVDRFRNTLETFIDQTRGVYGRSKEADDAIARSLGWLGVKYRLEDGKAKITDLSRLVAGLKEYEGRWREIYAEKIGSESPAKGSPAPAAGGVVPVEAPASAGTESAGEASREEPQEEKAESEIEAKAREAREAGEREREIEKRIVAESDPDNVRQMIVDEISRLSLDMINRGYSRDSLNTGRELGEAINKSSLIKFALNKIDILEGRGGATRMSDVEPLKARALGIASESERQAA